MVNVGQVPRLFRRRSRSRAREELLLPLLPQAPPSTIEPVFGRDIVVPAIAPLIEPTINPIPNWSRAVLDSTGISTSTCQVNGHVSDPSRLPVLAPDYAALITKPFQDGHQVLINPQRQCLFFTRLPVEIRQFIYNFAFGNKRIHMDYEFHHGKGRWVWWHRVCDDPEHCPEKENSFVCPECEGSEESMLKLGSRRWVKEGWEYKVRAGGWMKACLLGYRDVIPVLYSTNTFVFTQSIDQLFRFSRIMPSQQLALVSSLVVEIDVYRAATGPPHMDDRFRRFYESFFEIIHRSLPALRALRLSIAGLPSRSWGEVEWTPAEEWSWIGPWEELAQSRDWKRLEIAVPKPWIQELRGVVERRSLVEEARRYRLVPGMELYPRGW
ncbi:hypothetical protein BO94DRAFT_538158 [Aspergillus sclerotioniger CBS 115572]|uniref:DUF7730 domain-containing protein n=1 Tax=Aspergillus sclerotioniger CBS 115572 TaxID=1450535 RepID=A0A317VSJ4_9EURO|nr:hypothetical protein BO94DRAFT_538158 [Aspergillus sclerotioniger CBS 115572]PWY77293.1 hypothetical protein BO94DRAFT_538158 [Aspergillus sclerotioniger CBS 115572]